MREALQRLRHILGIPSALVIAAVAFGDTALGTISEIIPTAWGQLLWVAALGLTAVVLFHRWNKEYVHGLRASELGQPGTVKLSRRRGIVVMLGLDAAKADGSIARLLKEATSVEWIAFVGTPETAEGGVVREIREKLMPLYGRNLPASHVRTWEYANAESLADQEQSVTEAIQWMRNEGLAASDIVVDASNGRRSMYSAAMLSAELHVVEFQYLAPMWDSVANKPIKGREAFKVLREHYGEQQVGD